jgi:hypothetical protein
MLSDNKTNAAGKIKKSVRNKPQAYTAWGNLLHI